MMLQNTGAVISIAFVLAIITAAVPKDVLLQDLLRRRQRPLARAQLEPFIHNMHTALWVLAATSRGRRGRVAAAARARSRAEARAAAAAGVSAAPSEPRCASARSPSASGTTPRTIRYYEEIGLLGRRRRARGRRAPHLRRGGRRAPARAAAAEGPARRLARRAARAGRGRGRARRAARRVARTATRTRRGAREILERGAAATSTASSSWSPPARGDRRARGRARASAARACAALLAELRQPSLAARAPNPSPIGDVGGPREPADPLEPARSSPIAFATRRSRASSLFASPTQRACSLRCV